MVFGTIVHHETRRLLGQRRFGLLWLIWTALFGLALVNGWQQTRDYQQTYQTVVREQDLLWKRQGELNPHSAAHHGAYAFKPLNPLAAWEPGLGPFLGSNVFLEAHKQNGDRYRPAQDQLTLTRLAPVTVASLLQILLPLVTILMAYALFVQEREQGTWRLLLMQGVTPVTLFYGKWLALALTLTCLMALPVSAAVALMLSNGPLPAARLAIWSLAYALYALIFLWLSLLVSARAATSRGALLSLLALWFLNTVLVPRVGFEALYLLNPLPTAAAFQNAIAREQATLPDWETRLAKLKTELLKRYGVSEVSRLPVNLEGMVLQASEQDDARIFDRHFSTLYARYTADSQLYGRLGWLFPTVAIQSVSQALAGTNFDAHQHFLAAAEAYRQRLVGFLNQAIIDAPTQSAFERTVGNAFWQTVPTFAYQAPGLRAVLLSQLPALVALGLWCLALLALTPVLLRREA